jgi:transcriptional regulator with XRE-family HTH domain
MRLRQTRKEAKESQDSLAKALGVTHTQISDMENGKVATTLEKLVLLSERFHVSTDYLLGITDDPTWRGDGEE